MDAKAAVLEDALGMLASRSVANDNRCDLTDSRLRVGHVRTHAINKHHPRFECLCVCIDVCADAYRCLKVYLFAVCLCLAARGPLDD